MTFVTKPAASARLVGTVTCSYCRWVAQLTDDTLAEIVTGLQRLEAQHVGEVHPELTHHYNEQTRHAD